MMGNFLGDLIKNKEYKALPEPIRRGVELHRHIDAFTDSHEVVMSTVDKLESQHHKYSPVVADIYYDYLLFINWETYASESIQDLADWSYEVIRKYKEFIPERHSKKAEMMIKHNWLLGYGDLDILHETFLRVKKRARFNSHFEFATQHLQERLEDFNKDFNLFFPDLVRTSNEFIKGLEE